MMGAAMLKHHQFVWSLWALHRLVVSSITWGSQAQPLFFLSLLFFDNLGPLDNRCNLKVLVSGVNKAQLNS